MSFVRYCKLVILGILGRLTTPVKKDSINLLKTLMFPCMQKINFIPNFILQISKRYFKLFWVLETGLAKHIKTIRKVLAENLDVYHHAKNQLHCLLLSSDIAKIFYSCYFDYFRHDWLHPSDMTVPTLWILWSDLCKNQLYLLLPSRDTAKILQTCYFEYIGQE